MCVLLLWVCPAEAQTGDGRSGEPGNHPSATAWVDLRSFGLSGLGGLDDHSLRLRQWGGRARFGALGLALEAEVVRAEEEFGIRYRESDVALTMDHERRSTWLALRGGALSGWWSVGGRVRMDDGRSTRPDVSGSIALRPVTGLEAGAVATRQTLAWDDANFLLSGESGSMRWFVTLHRRSWHTELKARSGWRVRAELAESRADPGGLLPVTAGTVYGLAPAGLLLERSFAVNTPRRFGTMIGLQVRNFDLDGRLQGFARGIRFLHFGRIEGAARSWTLDVDREDRTGYWRAGYLSAELEFYAAGSLDAWPFLDQLARLIGDRRHVIATGQVRLSRVTWQREQRWARNGALRIGADWYRVLPDVSLKSWRAVFLGLGVQDLTRSRLTIRRLDLLQVHAGLTFQPVKRMALELEVRQWVPLGVQQYGSSSGTQSSPSGASDAGGTTGNTESATSRGASGGTFVRISASITI